MRIRRALFKSLGVVVFVLPLWVFLGRGFFGAPLGLQFLAQIVVVPMLFVGQVVATLVVALRPSVRRARAVSWIDAGLLALLWVGQLGIGFFLVDSSSSSTASAFSSLAGARVLGLSTALSATSIVVTIASGAALLFLGVWQGVQEARAGFQRTVADIEARAFDPRSFDRAGRGFSTGGFSRSESATPDFASDPDRVIRITPRS